MGQSDYYAKGEYNTICDVCGFKYKSGQLRKRWDGFMVCRKDWEPRNAQDYVRGVKDTQNLPWTRPESPDMAMCSTTTSIAGQATAGCSITGT